MRLLRRHHKVRAALISICIRRALTLLRSPLPFLLACVVASVGPSYGAVPPACLVGIYRAQDGTPVAIRKIPAQTNLRYEFSNGELGTVSVEKNGDFLLHPSWGDAKDESAIIKSSSCKSDLKIEATSGEQNIWTRQPLRLTTIEFDSRGTKLTGQLIEPSDGRTRHPLFVYVHGSEMTAAIDASTAPLLAAGAGIASFVFDKRGTGASQGAYTQNFETLATDAATAITAVRKTAGARIGRIGVAGFSQGGWVAPLAALKSPVDFVVVGYGVVGTALEQDAWQVDYELAAEGYGADVIHNAREVTDATARIAATNFTSGMDALHAVERKYGTEPWFLKISGQYSGEVLRGQFSQAQTESPEVLWHYDSQSVLKRLDVPQLWIMGGADSIAPSSYSIERLRALQRQGKAIDIAIFPNADHGIYEYRTAKLKFAGGARTSMGYYGLVFDWINGKLDRQYGDAQIDLH